VAAAAYRARTKIHDERQGITFDYSKKRDLVHSEIMLPEGAASWMGNRKMLWNRVEAGERRKDAQIFREVEVALPRELDREQRVALVREFVRDNFVSKGMVADINLHRDEHNPHAHILLTMRDIDGEGFGQKNRSWNQRALVPQWRKNWADIQNQHLRQAGYDITVDHRSYIDRGIDLEPQIKMGPACHDKDGDLDRVEELKRIMRENGERIIKNPNIALKALSSNKALFTDEDIHDFVRSHSRGNEQFQAACEAIYKSRELVFLGKGAGGHKRYTVNSSRKRYP
jgi:ATP-dependent exoDNAse (exonuclease V) alpha subunit